MRCNQFEKLSISSSQNYWNVSFIKMVSMTQHIVTMNLITFVTTVATWIIKVKLPNLSMWRIRVTKGAYVYRWLHALCIKYVQTQFEYLSISRSNGYATSNVHTLNPIHHNTQKRYWRDKNSCCPRKFTTSGLSLMICWQSNARYLFGKYAPLQ